MEKTQQIQTERRHGGALFALLCALGVGVNLLGAGLARALGLPLYLDAVGTILAAALGGYLPGIVVGYVSKLIAGIVNPVSAYYGSIQVLIALAAAFLAGRGAWKRFYTGVLTFPVFALIGGVLGGALTWLLSGRGFGADVTAPLVQRLYAGGAMPAFGAQLAGAVLVDLPDKAVQTLLASAVLCLLPESFRQRFRFAAWQQRPLTAAQRSAARQRMSRSLSLRSKILLLLGASALLVAVASTAISFVLYQRTTIQEHIKLGQGVAGLAAGVIDPERVDEYLALGEDAPGYRETEEMLYSVRNSSPDIEYVYVYQIREDGCHVVFDLDTDEVAGSDPGEVIPFDEAFAPYLPALLAGESIEPVVSNESFGWLLTVYQPVVDQSGVCRCYAAADISMDQLTSYEIAFLAKVISLFLGLFILTLALGAWLAEYNFILPINTMALAAGTFAYDSEEARAGSLERLRELDIRTGDEIENLYRAFAKTTEDTVGYIADVHEKGEVISRMQNGLIMVLADMVESRDQCTGDHVRKTAAYADIILRQMEKDGVYADVVDDDFAQRVVSAAPLHDVGKIEVSDTLLNKPGKLTDEEFRKMQSHTLAGEEIINQAIETVPETGYLEEARNLAAYHHERWDGKGYPRGLAGEEIPLSARIMAVADVFDALVSRRSYKEPFSFDQAMDIIRDGAGSHFDPQVAAAFLRARDEVFRVAEEHRDL